MPYAGTGYLPWRTADRRSAGRKCRQESDEGNWLVATNTDGSFGGFTAGHVTPELTKRKAKGGDAESKSLVVQFLDRLQFDRNYAILHAGSLDFSPEDIPLVNGVNLTFDSALAAGTSIVVKAVLSSDNSSTVEGLTDVDFKVTADGVDNVVTGSVMNPSGVYTLTVSTMAAAEVIVVDLWDSSLATSVIDSAGVLYRSDSIEGIVP